VADGPTSKESSGSDLNGATPNPDGNRDFIRADLEHVRFINFSLMAMCFLLIYLVWASWSDANEVLAELNSLKKHVNSALRAKANPEALTNIFPEVGQKLARRWSSLGKLKGLSKTSPSPMINFQRAIEDFLDLPVGFERQGLPNLLWPSIRLAPDVEVPVAGDQSLTDVRERFASAHWDIEVLDHFDGDAGKLRDWVAKAKSAQFASVDGPNVTGIHFEWPKTDSAGKARITFEMIFVSTAPHGDADPAHWVDDQQYVFDWAARRQTLIYSTDRFDKNFPKTKAHWQELSAKTLEEARTLMSQKTNESLQKKNVKLFEMEFAGQDIGIITPCFIAALLWYLVAYLSNLLEWLKANPHGKARAARFVSPWVGAMPNRWARFVSVFSLILMPLLAVSLSLWRLSNQNLLFALIIALVFAVFGSKCVKLGADINRAASSSDV
jgi:hypothetical protein